MMNTPLKIYAYAAVAAISLMFQPARAQQRSMAAAMAAPLVEKEPPAKWTYQQGVILEGMDGLWQRTADAAYYHYIEQVISPLITPEGKITTYKADDFSLDDIKTGRSLLTLYKVTGQLRYFKAATLLWEQLQQQPRTKEGGFCHTKHYLQMRLNDLYMAEPFYAEYAALTHHDDAFEDIARQFILMEKRAIHPRNGLLDSNAIGWYAMGLVDALEYFPESHPKRKVLLDILSRLAASIMKDQGRSSGLWYDVTGLPKHRQNHPEISASAMFVYALQKAVRLSLLLVSYQTAAKKGYQGILSEWFKQDSNGSFAYDRQGKVPAGDLKGTGAVLLAANEMELAEIPKTGQGKRVTLDCYFNSETRQDQSGRQIPWHYKWEERSNGGYSMWAGLFRQRGFTLASSYKAPVNLRGTSVYIITDPDIPKENPHPHEISPEDVRNITSWVRNGGVLVLMANDTGNAELIHLNELALHFGIQFNLDSKARVTGRNFEMGKIDVPRGNALFPETRQIYIKEFSSLRLSPPAEPVLADAQGNQVIAIARLGKGTVFAIGDPWLYNEYVDGRKLSREYENFKAADELTQWLARQIPQDKSR